MTDIIFGRKTHFIFGNAIWTSRKLGHHTGELSGLQVNSTVERLAVKR